MARFLGTFVFIVVAMLAAGSARAQEELPPAPLPAAVVDCASAPPGARIYVGHPQSRRGEYFKGITPAAVTIESSGSVPLEFRFTLIKPGYDEWTAVISVKRGDRIRLDAELEVSAKVAYLSGRDIMVMGYDGSRPRRVAALDEKTPPTRPSFSPDGRFLAFADRGEIWAVGTDGLQLQQLSDVRAALSRLNIPIGEWTSESPAWSPDGRWIAFRLDQRSAVSDQRSAPGPEEPPSDLLCLVPADVQEFASAEGVTQRIAARAAEPLVLGPGARAFAWCPAAPSSGAADQAPYSPRRLAVQDDTSLRILAIGVDGTVVPRAMIPGGEKPAWSPDGSRLAYVSGGQILLCEPTGAGVTAVTDPGAEVASPPCWSPDGQRIVYLAAGAEGEELALHIRTLDGVAGTVPGATDGERATINDIILPLPESQEPLTLEGFTPDGLGVAVHGGAPTEGPTWVVKADGSGAAEWIASGGLLACSGSLILARTGNLPLFEQALAQALAEDNVETLSLLALDPLWTGTAGGATGPCTGEKRWAALEAVAGGVDEELAWTTVVEPAQSEAERILSLPDTLWRIRLLRGEAGWRIAEITLPP